MMGTLILVVEDNPDVATVLCDRLHAMGHEVMTAGDGQAALDALQKITPTMIFLDIELPKVNGMEVLKRVRKEWPDLPVIVMTAYGTIQRAVEAMKEGATDFVTKPFETGQLSTVITKALERKELSGEVGRLLGDISHDIKNLLQPVVSGTWLLESEIKDIFHRLPAMEAVKAQASHELCDEVIGMLRQATGHIHDRVKEIADCVKGMSAPPRFAPCRVAGVVGEVFKTLGLLAEEKKVALRAEGLEALPTILADERRLFNAFYNLVNNAIPEVPAGGSITVRGRADVSSDAVLLLVEDTGQGMPTEIRDSLFTARAISRKAGGTGLGTKIVKDVVDAHGGRISVASTEGVGTTFQIRIPLAPPGASRLAKVS
jgi:signal transduction histidine kinase